MDRSKVYEALDSERAYQMDRWNEHTTTSGGHHSLEEWLLYMRKYMEKAEAVLTEKPRQVANPEATEILRKVTALGVAALEEHGCDRRAGY